MRTPEELAALYCRAADYVRTHGLARRVFELPDGRVCTVGALAKGAGVHYTEMVYDVAYDAEPIVGPVAEILGYWSTEDSSKIGWIAKWSDAPERTAEEVAALLEYVALRVLATAEVGS